MDIRKELMEHRAACLRAASQYDTEANANRGAVSLCDQMLAKLDAEEKQGKEEKAEGKPKRAYRKRDKVLTPVPPEQGELPEQGKINPTE